MLLTTSNDIPGKEFEALGLVSGNTVQSKNVFKDIGAGLRNIVGGEVGSYTKMLIEARQEATNRMMAEAEQMGADAIIMIRYGSSSIMEGALEMFAYGTAVKDK